MNPYVLADGWLQQLLSDDVPHGDPYQAPPKDVQVTFAPL